jgi:hypothetical protein
MKNNNRNAPTKIKPAATAKLNLGSRLIVYLSNTNAQIKYPKSYPTCCSANALPLVALVVTSFITIFPIGYQAIEYIILHKNKPG